MIINSDKAEMDAVLNVAQQMCAAARTAPKTKGQDYIHTCILTEEHLEILALKMEESGKELGYGFFLRDAGNVRASKAVVLLGVENVRRGLGSGCSYCGHEGCNACKEVEGTCVFGPLDLGIAIGSAVSVAADARIDSRIMFSVGRAALDLGFFDKSVTEVIGIPLSVSGKSPYFDRK